MTLSERLKQARESIGRTQKEMAKLAGVSTRVWRAYEAGSVIPGGKIFESLSNLGFNTNWLLTGVGPMKIMKDYDAQEAKELDNYFGIENAKLVVNITQAINMYEETLKKLFPKNRMVSLLGVLLAIYSKKDAEDQSPERIFHLIEIIEKLSDDYDEIRTLRLNPIGKKLIADYLNDPSFAGGEKKSEGEKSN